MPVRDDQVEIAVVVEVGERSTPRHRPVGDRSDTRLFAGVLEQTPAQAAVQGGEVLREVGDEDVEQTVPCRVAHRDPHAGLGRPIGVEGAPRPDAGLLEGAVPLVAV